MIASGKAQPIRLLAHSLLGGVALWLLMAILGLNWRVLIIALGFCVVYGVIFLVCMLVGKEK